MSNVLSLDASRCLSCGGCAGLCPELALELTTDLVLQIDQEKCTGCGLCVKICPINALRIYHEAHEEHKGKINL